VFSLEALPGPKLRNKIVQNCSNCSECMRCAWNPHTT